MSVPTTNWPPETWVVTDGKAGKESQCLGLAEAMGLHASIKRVHVPKVWREVALNLRVGSQFALRDTDIRPPWPDIMIAAGRTSVVASLHVKKVAGPSVFVVQLQNPRIPVEHFDLVVAPYHDRLAGRNVVRTVGAMHRVTPRLLQAHANIWAPRFADIPRPQIAVLLGGSNSSYRLDTAQIDEIGSQLKELASANGVGLLITASRRTGAENVDRLRSILNGCKSFIWDGEGDNPYFGILGLAQSIIVTWDSVNMISEACSTGKPVHVIQLPGRKEAFSRFHAQLTATNRIRPFVGRLEQWEYEPLQETAQVAGRVREAYWAHRGGAVAPVSR